MTNSRTKLQSLTLTALLVLSALAVVAVPGTAQTGNAGNASVTFADQTTDGTTVTVDSVTVSEGGFVAIHNESLLTGDAVGSVVGVSAYLEPGTHEDVPVTLFEGAELTADGTLIAMPHLDTNGNESYDFVVTGGLADGPYLDDGQPVTDSANVTVDEPTAGDSFTVDSLAVPSVVERESNQTVTATVTNPNDDTETQPVTFRFDGDVVVREQVTLGPGESTTVSYALNTSVADGTYILGVYTRTRGQPAQVRLVEEIESLGVDTLSAPSTVTVGDTVTVTATITNPNEFLVSQPVEFRFSGDVVENRTLTVPANGSTTETFTVETAGIEPATYIHSVFTDQRGRSALITLTAAENGGATPTPNETESPPLTPTPNGTESPAPDETESPPSTPTPNGTESPAPDETESPPSTPTPS